MPKFSSVHFSHSVTSYSFRPHGLQHARPHCPSPTPRVYSNSCPLSQWCNPTISSSVVPFSSCPQSFPASGSFQMSQLFASGSQSIGVSSSTSALRMNIQDWSPLGWTGWFSLQSKGLSRVFSNTTVQKHQFFGAQLSLWSNSHILHGYWENHEEVKSLSRVRIYGPMDCILSGSSVHGILQAGVLEWVTISFSRRSSWPRHSSWVSHIVGRHFIVWATFKTHKNHSLD